jgi:HD-GYP domain-containing protein (c-di-GMP phosphodiesterase class II)
MGPSDCKKQLLLCISHIVAAITNIRLYSREHPQAQLYIDKAFTVITNVLNKQPDLTFILIGEDLILNKTPLKEVPPHISRFRQLLKENGIERLSFTAGFTQFDLELFIQDLISPKNQSIQSRPGIRLGKVGLYSQDRRPTSFSTDPITVQLNNSSQLEAFDTLKQVSMDNFREVYSNIKRQKTANMKGLDGIVNSFVKGFSHGLKPLQMLANLKGTDQYTFTHVVNVCLLTMAQAELLGISGSKLFEIGIAAVLHDVGKLFIPDDILNKPGALTKEERNIIETHSESGARYILKLTNVPKLAILGALEHHIRYDGKGYPFINSHWRPHLISQMIAIADVYDAMRSRRPYQNPKPEKMIVSVLKKEKGSAFNPFLVNNFLTLLHQTAQSVQNQRIIFPDQSHLDQTHIPQIEGF